MREASFWNDIVSKSMTIYANLIFLVLWVGIVVALAMNRQWIDDIWIWAQGLPTVPKIIVWVLFLPIMVSLWIWESSWSTFGRVLAFGGIVVWTFLAVRSIFISFR
jgi:hypothetical protein